MNTSLTGWLLDIYPNENDLTLWVIAEDGQSRCLHQDFVPTLYVDGPDARLRKLWKWLSHQPVPVRLQRTKRIDVFKTISTGFTLPTGGPDQQRLISVLGVDVLRPASLDALFRSMVNAFPDLIYYDADISLALRHAAAFGLFPLAYCRLQLDGDRVLDITPLDTPWDIEPQPAPLRILTLEPDCDPAHGEPQEMIVSHDRARYCLSLHRHRSLLVSLAAILHRYDPDLLLTSWGDTWLLPFLLEASRKSGLELPLNRDAGQSVLEHKAHTYFSYGQIVFRGRQTQLRGRWHLDRHNAVLWRDYGLEGVLEMARVTRQPVQDAARLSPGTGISAMQFVTALQNGILIPWHKHQAETPKTAMGLLRADTGGIVYQPTVGLHRDVGGIDFVSMYPGIMVRFNISPEVPRASQDLEPSSGEPGIVPLTLAPLLNKRLALKSALLDLHRYDCRRPLYTSLASAHKWLLVTCFGYLGYKNARFGRIEAHEAVTAYGREALMRAKEAAEDQDYKILHMYVDGLWVQKPGCRTPSDFDALLSDIMERTGLPISLDGVYRWVVFLPSRQDARVPVPNRYFGVFQDGTVKVRGIEARRHDTPPYIKETQLKILEILSHAPDADQLGQELPEAQSYARSRQETLRRGDVPVEDLLVSLKLSRELDEYSSPSPAARAAQQLQEIGKTVSPGQKVRFLFTLGKPGVHAWDVPEPPDLCSIDLRRYNTLFERAANAVLVPIQQSVHGALDRQGRNLYLIPPPASYVPLRDPVALAAGV